MKAYALALALAVGGLGMAAGPAMGEVAKGSRVMVIPFSTLNVPAEQQWIGKAMQESLMADLGRDLTAVSFDGQTIIEDNPAAARVAREASVPYAVRGSAQVVNGEVRLTAQMIDAKTGETVGTAIATGPVNDLFKLEDQIAAQLHGGPAAGPQGTPLAPAYSNQQVTTFRSGNNVYRVHEPYPSDTYPPQPFNDTSLSAQDYNSTYTPGYYPDYSYPVYSTPYYASPYYPAYSYPYYPYYSPFFGSSLFLGFNFRDHNHHDHHDDHHHDGHGGHGNWNGGHWNNGGNWNHGGNWNRGGSGSRGSTWTNAGNWNRGATTTWNTAGNWNRGATFHNSGNFNRASVNTVNGFRSVNSGFTNVGASRGFSSMAAPRGGFSGMSASHGGFSGMSGGYRGGGFHGGGFSGGHGGGFSGGGGHGGGFSGGGGHGGGHR
jgi:TolB-like protein